MFKDYLRNGFNSIAAQYGSHQKDTAKPRLWILMYHRIIPDDVAKKDNEEPGMFVTPTTFRQHIKWLTELMPIMRLTDWCSSSVDKLPKRAAAITFDDGWQDNYHYAFPILKEKNILATIFLVSHLIGTKKTFWPNRLSVVLRELSCRTNWPDSARWLELENTKDFRSLLQNNEIRSHIISRCKSLLDSEICNKLDQLELDLALNNHDQRHLLNWQEVNEMKASGLIDFGSHTCNHYRLSSELPENNIEQEIIDSWHEIEHHIGYRPTAFCYPNGERCLFADKVVSENYSIAVTTERGINEQKKIHTELKRIGFHEDISKNKIDFMARLANWR